MDLHKKTRYVFFEPIQIHMRVNAVFFCYMHRWKFFTVVGKIDYDFSANYVAFENIMWQVYYDWNRYSEWLTRKMDVLVTSPLKYRIVLVSDEEKSLSGENFYEEIKNSR